MFRNRFDCDCYGYCEKKLIQCQNDNHAYYVFVILSCLHAVSYKPTTSAWIRFLKAKDKTAPQHLHPQKYARTQHSLRNVCWMHCKYFNSQQLNHWFGYQLRYRNEIFKDQYHKMWLVVAMDTVVGVLCNLYCLMFNNGRIGYGDNIILIFAKCDVTCTGKECSSNRTKQWKL